MENEIERTSGGLAVDIPWQRKGTSRSKGLLPEVSEIVRVKPHTKPGEEGKRKKKQKQECETGKTKRTAA